jgi:hypothetical protein
VSGSRNCVWSAPFRPVRVTIMDSAFTRRMDRGGAGRIGVRIQSNDLSVPLVRAVAFNVRNPSHYTSPPLSQVLTKATEDCWVVIVQNSRNGRTACEAFWNAPSHDEARRSGRKFLRVPLFGSNPYCPAVSTAAIPCVSQLPGSRISSMDTDAVSSVPWELRLASRGMGECVLPDLD